MNKKLNKLFIIAVGLLLYFLISTEVQAQIAWNKMSITVKRSINTKEIVLQGIRGTSKNDVFAVGRVENTDVETNNTGVILHYDGNPARIWEEILPNEKKPKNLNAICRGAKGDFFAVGDEGSIFLGKGKKWKKVPQKKFFGNLLDVWVSPKNTIFAVGDKGTILTGTKGGKGWSSKKVMDKKLNAVWGISAERLLVVGEGGTILFSNNGGKSWETRNNPDPDNHNLNSIWGFSEKLLYAVGEGGTILFSNDGGNTWIQQNNPVSKKHNLNSIWGISPNAVFAAGTPGTVLRCKKNEWSPLKSTTLDLTSVILNAIWVSSNPNAFIIGPGGFTGIGQLPPGYYIEGFIRDACSQISQSQPDPAGINDAKGCIVTPTGCPDVITADSNGRYEATPITVGGPKIRFYHSNGKYKKEEPILSLYHNHSISNTTFLIPDSGVSNPLTGADCCISGVISKRCNSWYCPVGDITVNLYELINCEYEFSQYIETNDLGFYNFTGLGQGSYKIIPVAPEGCTFTPDTTNVFSIPIGLPEAINFTDITLEGTGDCECLGNPDNPCNLQ